MMANGTHRRIAAGLLAAAAAWALGGCAAPAPQGAVSAASPASAASAAAPQQAVARTPAVLERCEKPLGTLVLREDETSPWFAQLRQQQLGSTLPLLRRMIAQSNCFTLVDREPSVIERNLMARERNAASGGSTTILGQLLGADFTMSPRVAFGPPVQTGALVGAVIGQALGKPGSRDAVVAGAMPGAAVTKDTSTTLQLTDNRSGVQITVAEGSPRRTGGDPASLDPAALAASGIDYGKTPQGQAVVAAFADSYNQTVKALRNYQAQTVPGGLNAGGRLAVQPDPEPLRPYVNLDAPRSARPAQKIAVQVWLSQRRETPEARVEAPGARQPDPQGRLGLTLPRDRRSWTIRVVLIAPGFDFEPGTSNVATLQLTDQETSDTAGFFLLARDDQAGLQGLRATLWHEGAYLGSVSRDIRIEAPSTEVGLSTTDEAPVPRGATTLRAGAGMRAAPLAQPVAPELASPGAFVAPRRQELPAAQPATADLTVLITHDDPRSLGRYEAVVWSPHLQGPPTSFRDQHPSDAARWLAAWLDRLHRVRAGAGAEATALNVDVLRGLGVELYQRLAPPNFRSALAGVLEAHPGKTLTIQVFSNNPSIPWELMRPGLIGGRDVGFLGTDFRMARWPVDGSARTPEVPRQSIALREIVVIAPRYEGDRRLQAQDEEVSFLSRLRGFRLAAGTAAGLRQVAANPPAGIVHFAGHGEATGATPELRRFQLRLEDSRFDSVAWQGLVRRANTAGSLYFFNACELGATESQAGAVAGWAPVLLDGGASGFIGGLWSLPDGPASRFAMRFYGALGSPGSAAPRRSVTEALRQARTLFFETGDPAYLAYAYYGDVNLELAAP